MGDGAYVELLSFYEPSPKHYWWDAVHGRGGGLIDFCAATDDIRGDYARFAEQGVEMSPLVGLSRERVDGYRLAWTNNEIYGRYQGLIPFLIEDETPRHERVPKDKVHANGVTGIERVTLVAADIELARRIMSAVLGQAGEEGADDALGASGVVYTIGSHRLEYLTPHDSDSPLHGHLADNKPLPWRVRFTTDGEKQTIDLSDVAGVRIEFV